MQILKETCLNFEKCVLSFTFKFLVSDNLIILLDSFCHQISTSSSSFFFVLPADDDCNTQKTYQVLLIHANKSYNATLTAVCVLCLVASFTETTSRHSPDETLFYYLQGGNGSSTTTTGQQIYLLQKLY